MGNESIRYLIVPGWQGSPEDHWQTHWQNSLPNSARVEQADWLTPRREDWVAALAEVTVAEYRAGNSTVNYVHKLPGIHKAGDVTLKRGLIASLDLWNWVNQVRRGNMDARATVVIQLLSEDHAATVASWKLINARPSKWTGPTLAAKGGSDVAMEELTLVCEDLEFE